MPTIAVTDSTYRKLQSLAKPFVDTEESVILAALEALIETRGQKDDKRSQKTFKRLVIKNETQIMKIDVNSRVGLTHTRIRSAEVDGQPIYNPNWNSVMQQLLVLGNKYYDSVAKLSLLTKANLEMGRNDENGFKYISEANFSVQGVSAQTAWAIALDLAKQMGVSIRIVFEWHYKPEAANPGRTGELCWKPNKTLLSR